MAGNVKAKDTPVPSETSRFSGVSDDEFVEFAVSMAQMPQEALQDQDFMTELETRVNDLNARLWEKSSKKSASNKKAEINKRAKEYKLNEKLSKKVLMRLFREMPDKPFVAWGLRNYVDSAIGDSTDRRIYNVEAAARYKASEGLPPEPDTWCAETHDIWRGTHDAIGDLVTKQTSSLVRKKIYDRNNAWAKYSQEKDNIYQTTYMDVFRRFGDYNGDYALTTFFTMLMTGADTKTKAEANHYTVHEQELTSKVRKAINRLVAKGYDPDDILVDDLVPILGDDMTERAIDQALMLLRQEHVSYSADYIDATSSADNEYSNPARKAVNNEAKHEIDTLLGRLQAHERMVVKLAHGYFDDSTGFFNHKLSVKWIARHRAFLNEVAQLEPKQLFRLDEEQGQMDIDKELNKESNPLTYEESLMLSIRFSVKESYVTKLLDKALKKIRSMPEAKGKMKIDNGGSSYGAHLNFDGFKDAMETMEILEAMDDAAMDDMSNM